MATKAKKTAVGTPAAKRMTLELPSKTEFTLAMPGLEKMVLELATRAMEFEDRKRGGGADPREDKRLALEAVRITIEQDHQKLAWEEFKLRKAEFEARERQEQERREERRAEKEERQREQEKREREDAIARGEVYDVWLTAGGATKIQVIKVIREFTALGLKEAKDVVDACPCAVKETMLKNEAQRLLLALTQAGAGAEIHKATITTDNVRNLY